MHSFDDYYYFFLVVKYAGFSAASEASNITKSKLSRRILDLESQFNVSLIQRSTRHFKVTPLGQEFYEECCKVIAQIECVLLPLVAQRRRARSADRELRVEADRDKQVDWLLADARRDIGGLHRPSGQKPP